MDIVNPGKLLGRSEDMVLSDVGMITKDVEVLYHMRNYPFKPLDSQVAESLDMIFEGEFDQMRLRTMRALDIPMNFFNTSP